VPAGESAFDKDQKLRNLLDDASEEGSEDSDLVDGDEEDVLKRQLSKN